jgi:hypothetical protein
MGGGCRSYVQPCSRGSDYVIKATGEYLVVPRNIREGKKAYITVEDTVVFFEGRESKITISHNIRKNEIS